MTTVFSFRIYSHLSFRHAPPVTRLLSPKACLPGLPLQDIKQTFVLQKPSSCLGSRISI